MKAKTLRLAVILALLVITAVATLATTPTGPDSVIVRRSSTRSDFSEPPKSLNAEAGNLTELEVNITQQTDHWQGYYGNITGVITLDDASNNTMYSWTGTINAKGNIYATTNTVSNWPQVECMNTTERPGFNCTGEDEICLNISSVHSTYGMVDSDGDTVAKTFTSTNKITVDTLTLTNCPATNLYENSTAQSKKWNETLLTINNTNNLIFAVQLENDKYGFNNQTWDFQIMVAENDAAGTTQYYFYVELA